jgi:hypothetical protein
VHVATRRREDGYFPARPKHELEVQTPRAL